MENHPLPSDIHHHLRALFMLISPREFANHYFHRPSTWFYHKLDGTDAQGRPTPFTPEELTHLRASLLDLSDRIRRLALHL